MSTTGDLVGFEIVTIPISHYRHHPDLPEAQTEAERVVNLFAQFGGQASAVASTDQNLDETAAKDLLRRWAGRATARSSVLVWLGHGASDGDEAWLACYETPHPINGNGMVPKALADQISSDWRQRAADDTAWALVIIEACGAGRFVSNINALLMKDPPRRLALIGVGGDGIAYLGSFGNALAETIGRYTVNDEDAGLRDFIEQLQEFLPDDHHYYPLRIDGRMRLPRKRLIGTPISATVDVYRELEELLSRLSDDERLHFIPKAQGAEHNELAWYFVGRAEQRRKIAAWLRESTHGMFIVTGRAGTGKSALLGNVLVYTNPGLRELLVTSGQLEPATSADLPPDHVFDAVVHLTGMTTAGLVGRVAAALDVILPAAESAESGQDLEAVLAHVRDRSFTLLVDALDEAQEPATIAGTVLQRLAALPHTRVVVGTRASTQEGPDQPFTNDEDLLDALGQGNATRLTVQRDPEEIAAYLRRRLVAALGEGSHADQAAIDRVVELATNREREFLFARLAVHEIRARPGLLSPESRGKLETLLDGDHRTLFAAAVARLTADSPPAGPLLEALALARGRGAPRADRVWVTIADAVSYATPPRELDIDNLLAAAAPYIMLDAEDGQSVYRLAHQTFREFFISSGEQSQSARHRQVATALLAATDDTTEPNPYLVHRLAEYVAEANAWDDLAAAPAVLNRVNPESVAAEALRTAYGRADLPLAIAASLSARHLLSSVGVKDRQMTRQVAMACLQSADFSLEANDRQTAEGWARLDSHDPLHVLMIGHEGPIRSATALHLADGRVLLATGADDGTVRVWDPNTGRPVGDPLEAAGSPGFRLAEFHSGDGRTLLAIGGRDGRLSLWDPATGHFHYKSLAGHIGPMRGIACLPRQHGGDVIVTCGSDRKLLRWEVAPGRPITHKLLVDDYLVRAMSSLSGPLSQALLATGGYDAEVRLWDLETGQPRRFALAGYRGAVHDVATLSLGDRQFVAAGGDDGTVLLWDPRSGQPDSQPLLGHSGAVEAVVGFTLPDGRALFASGGEDAAVRLWNAATGGSEGILTGHKRPVHALAAVELPDGRTLLASGAEDNTVRLWDPGRAPRVSVRRGRPAARALCLATVPMPEGQTLLMTGDDEGTILLRDPRTGEPIRVGLQGEGVPVHAVAAIELPHGEMMVAATGAGSSVARWMLHPDAAPGLRERLYGDRFGERLYGHTGSVCALAGVSLPEGRVGLASAGQGDANIMVWDLPRGRSNGILRGGHRGAVNALMAVTTAQGQSLLASAGDPDVCLWDAATCELLARLCTETAVSFAALSTVSGPEGEVRIAAGARDGSVYLWDTAALRLTDKLCVARERVLSLATVCLPDGREILAAGTADGYVRLWDAVRGALLRTVPLPLDQQPRNLAAVGTSLAVQTDLGVIVTALDPDLITPDNGYDT